MLLQGGAITPGAQAGIDRLLEWIKERFQITCTFDKLSHCVPRQENVADCGMFVLLYMQCIALNGLAAPMQFAQADISKARVKLVCALCDGNVMSL